MVASSLSKLKHMSHDTRGVCRSTIGLSLAKKKFKPGSSMPSNLSKSVAVANSSRQRIGGVKQMLQGNKTSLPVQRLKPNKMREKQRQGLCYNCEEKWMSEHRCKPMFFCMKSTVEEVEKDQIDDEALVEVVISTLNSLAGPGAPRSLHVWGNFGNKQAHVLIDYLHAQFRATQCSSKIRITCQP